jgi:AcrR family transcriptional regulator
MGSPPPVGDDGHFDPAGPAPRTSDATIQARSPGQGLEDPPILGARARKRAETKERIFETALREFRDVGVASAQIDRIARAAGVARGTFYFHFPTKDDVLLELARRINLRLVRRIGVLGETDPSLRELLEGVNDAILDEFRRVGDTGLLRDLLSLYARRPYDLTDPIPNVPTLASELGRHLRREADRGELRSSLPVEHLAVVVITSLFGILTRIPHGEDLRVACGSLIDLLVKGLQFDDPMLTEDRLPRGGEV